MAAVQERPRQEFSKMSMSNSAVINLMQERLRQMALSPQIALAANPIPIRPKIGKPDSICTVCQTSNPARNFRCKKCDSVIIKQRPNGKFEDQLEYTRDYLAEHSEFEAQMAERRKIRREGRS